MRKAIKVLMVLVMLSVVAGGVFAQKKQLNIVFVTPLVAHPVWDVARAGFEAAAKELGFKGQYVGPQGIDPAEMVNQIELAIAMKVDGIITMPISPTAMRPVLKKAAAAKIPVVFVGAEDPESTALAFIGTNEVELGRQGGNAIKLSFGKTPIRAIVMQSTMDASFAIKARDGYLAALKDYPDFKMVLNESCNSDMQIAMQKFEAAFKAYPEINLVIGVCGEAGPAAAKVIKENKLEGKITVVAIDDVEETLSLIKDGSIWGTEAQNFYKMGNLGSRILVDYITKSKKPASFKNDSGSIFVTMSNFNTYRDALYK
ncbi:MAG: substrate-binding domain-containing protein [Spirochaetota bacterium]